MPEANETTPCGANENTQPCEANENMPEANENMPCGANGNTLCGANENEPCEDVPIACNDEFEDLYPEECNEAAPSLIVNELLNQTIEIDTIFVTNITVKAVEETFGKTSKVAATFKALLRYMKQPSKWLIKLIKKRKQKSLTET